MGFFTINDLYNLSGFGHGAIFQNMEYLWDVLKGKCKSNYIKKVINPNCSAISREGGLVKRTTIIYKNEIFKEGFEIVPGSPTKDELKVYKDGELLTRASVIHAGAYIVGNEIEIGEGCLIEEGAYITGPTILGDMCEIRHGAYIRGELLTGKRCVIGHASEIKGTIMLDDAKAPHFAYVGDSVLGNRVNLGAGTKVSNLKITGDEIVIKHEGKEYKTGLRKFGALIGDHVETGCNSVLNPGVILGRESMVYPCIAVRKGYYPPKTLLKGDSIERVRD